VQQSPVFIAAIGMAVLAFAVGTLGAISLLSAGSGEDLQKLDAEVWLWLGFGLAIASAGVCLLLRLQANPPAGTAEGPSQDRSIGLALLGLTMAFVLLALFKGFDESPDAVLGWTYYADIFAFLAIAWFVIARPTPAMLGGLDSTVIGLGAIAVAAVALLIGLVQGRSEDYSTYVQGLALLRSGIVIALLAFAWFAGMRPVASR
jgi:hypothetical protein